MLDVPAYILAGGKSSRFGSDKAQALLHGTPLVLHVVRALRAVSRQVTVVADRQDRYRHLQLRTVVDQQPDCGPLGGLSTALADAGMAGHCWALVSACDTPLLPRPWLANLLLMARGDSDAVAYRDDCWQPFPSLFGLSALPVVNRQLASDNRSLQLLLNQLRTVGLAKPADWPPHWQANTKADLEAIARGMDFVVPDADRLEES